MVVNENCCIISELGDFCFLYANDNAFDVIVAFARSSIPTTKRRPDTCHLKADFQSVLRALESLFTTFVLFHVRRHKM